MLYLTNGCFDGFHPGHKYFFNKIISFMCQQNDLLVVLLNTDSSIKNLKGSSRPINNYNKRQLEIINYLSKEYPNLRYVFHSFSTEETLEQIMTRYKPDIIIKGNDRKNLNDIVGADKYPTLIIPGLKDKNNVIYSTTNTKQGLNTL